MIHAQSIPTEWCDQVNLDLETASHTIPSTPTDGPFHSEFNLRPYPTFLFPCPLRLSFAPSLSSTLSSLLCVMYRSMLGHVCPYSRLYTRRCVYRSSFGRRWQAVACFLSLSLPLDRYKGANWQYRENARKLAGTTFNDVRKFVNARQKWSIISGRCLSVSRHIASRFMHFASPWNFAPRRCTRLIRSQWKL